MDMLPRNKIGLGLLVVLSAVFLSFLPSLNNGFTNYDDTVHLTENPVVRHLDFHNLKKMFSQNINRVYIPLTTLSFALEYHFFGMNPFVAHFNNLFLHLAIVSCIFFLSLQLGLNVRIAVLASLLFGIHPMHVESVAWLTQRKDVLYSFFYVLALLSYVQYLKTGQISFYLMTIPLGLLSILAKPMALSLPLVFFLCDWLYERKDTKRLLLEKIPHCVYIAALVLKSYMPNTQLVVASTDLPTAILIGLWSLTFNIYKFFIPIIFSPVYELPKPVFLFNLPYLRAVVLFFTVMLFLIRFRNNKWLLFAFGYYLASMFFLVRFNDISALGMNSVADRFMYLPSLGFCLWIAVSLDKFLEGVEVKKYGFRAAVYGFLGIIILSLSVKTFYQCRIWKDSFTVWSYVLKYFPSCHYAYNNRGSSLMKENKIREAMEDFNQAVTIKPDYEMAYFNRGKIYYRVGDYRLAFKEFNEAIQSNPEFAAPYIYRGELYQLSKEYGLAIKDFNRVLEIKPEMGIAVYNNRGLAYSKIGKSDLALQDYTKALSIEPHYLTFYNRADLYKELKQYNLALEDYKEAVKLNSTFSKAWNMLGLIYHGRGQFDQAVQSYDQAILANSKVGTIYFNRAKAFEALGDTKSAQKDYKKAESLGYKAP